MHSSLHDAFVERLDAAVRDAVIGDPTREDVLFGPMLDQKFADRLEKFLDMIAAHHTVHGSDGTGRITADNPRSGFAGDAESGLYYHPVVVDGVRPDDALFSTETFGPIIGVASYDDLEEAIAWSNLPGYGLSSSIYTNDPKTVFTYRKGVRSGMLSVNNSTSGAEAHLPFGGNGLSGNGSRQGGVWVLDQMTRWQAVNWDYSGRLQKAQIDTSAGTDAVVDLDYRLDI